VTGQVRCTVCGQTNGRELFTTRERRFGLGDDRFAVIRCAGCGLVRTEPQPKVMGDYYPRGYYSFQPPAGPTILTRARIDRRYHRPIRAGRDIALLSRIAAKRLTPGLPPGPPGRLVDVGCGSGEDLAALRYAGWDARGVEVSSDAVDAARAAGLDVHLGDLRNADFESQSFDAVRFWHSLEHTESPRDELAEARRILRPGGTITVGVPNFASLLARLSKHRWFYLDVPRHLWHFESRPLARLLRETGFRDPDVRLVTTSSPLLGTLDFLRGRDGVLASRRALWLAALPIEMALDAIGLGDAIEATAVAA
jgi:SAM-dependent methyltransferase